MLTDKHVRGEETLALGLSQSDPVEEELAAPDEDDQLPTAERESA